MDLYGGDFLAGFSPLDAAPFEEWALVCRADLHHLVLDALATLAAAHEVAGDYSSLCRRARRQLALEPWHEPAHRSLMRGLASAGQRSAALNQYEQCRSILAHELGVEPDPATTALAEQIGSGTSYTYVRAATKELQCGRTGLYRRVSAAPHDRCPNDNLAAFGRTDDRSGSRAGRDHSAARRPSLPAADIDRPGRRRQDPPRARRGAPALRSAPRWPPFHPAGIAGHPELLLPTIARALGVAHNPHQPLIEALRAALIQRPCLLVLDNFEHLASAAPLLADLCAACPALRLLVTSRVVLHLQAEQVYPVSPLALAAPRHLPPPHVLGHIPAVQLFVERARAVKPDFALTPANAETVARICALVDGLPLAIELAATRVRILPVQALLRRLEGGQVGPSLQVLAGGARDLPERQRTMHATIAWSYDLLPAEQRVLLRRLGVFRGGWLLDAAAAVCGDLGGLDVLDGLSALAEQSLLVVKDAGGEPRFDMLDTIREYALERLEASGEGEAIRQRHTDFFVQFAETVEPVLLGPRAGATGWTRWKPSTITCAPHCAGRLNMRPSWPCASAGLCARFWYGHTHLSEGRQWLEAVLARPAGDGGVQRAASGESHARGGRAVPVPERLSCLAQLPRASAGALSGTWRHQAIGVRAARSGWTGAE